MKSQVLNSFPWPEMTVVAFLIFFIFFFSMIFWTLRTGSRRLYEGVSNIPLEEPREVNHE